MTRPWREIDSADTEDGRLTLRTRGDGDYLISLDGRILMNSAASRSEVALARLGCARLAGRTAARLLIGGLGMGCTLRAALDALPPDAEVHVAELHTAIADWCRGPLAGVNGGALDDPRVSLEAGDVARTIRRAAGDPATRYDAILLDLFEGPHAGTRPDDPVYGDAALARTRKALRPGGVLGVWSEERDAGFERRLARAGLRVGVERPGRGGRRHAVILGTRPDEVAQS